MRCKLARLTLLSVVVPLGIGTAAAGAQEYCVEGCVVGRTCPTQPPVREPGHVELPLCTFPTNEPAPEPEPRPPSPSEPAPEPEPAFIAVEDETVEAASQTTAAVAVRVESHHDSVSSVMWRYSMQTVLGEESLLDASEVPGSLTGSEGVLHSTATLAALLPGTTYYVRAVVATGSGEFVYGPIESFSTQQAVTEGPSGGTGAGITFATSAGAMSGQVSSSTLIEASVVTAPVVPVSRVGGFRRQSQATAAVRRRRELAKALRACLAKLARDRPTCVREARARYGGKPRQFSMRRR